MRQESDVEQTIGQYADMVKHICFVYMKNESDTEDVFQDVFLKYALFSEPFDSEEHKISMADSCDCKQVQRFAAQFLPDTHLLSGRGHVHG